MVHICYIIFYVTVDDLSYIDAFIDAESDFGPMPWQFRAIDASRAFFKDQKILLDFELKNPFTL